MMNTQVEVYVPAFNAPIPFVSGDALGTEKRELALLDATIQGSLQEKGSVRDKLYALQGALTNLPEVDCPLQHMFAPGVYIRTIFIPKGTCVVGKIHKHRHANILSSGSVLVLTESGGLEKLTGPVQMVSEPGTKRAVYAETDVVWTTIHPTEETDLEKIEEEVIAKTFQEYNTFLLGEKT